MGEGWSVVRPFDAFLAGMMYAAGARTANEIILNPDCRADIDLILGTLSQDRLGIERATARFDRGPVADGTVPPAVPSAAPLELHAWEWREREQREVAS